MTEKEKIIGIDLGTSNSQAKFTANSSDELGHIVIEGFIVHTSEDIDKIYNKWQDEKVLDIIHRL